LAGWATCDISPAAEEDERPMSRTVTQQLPIALDRKVEGTMARALEAALA
jgi:hypothetical protein